MSGAPGNGKTHLAVAVYKAFIEKGVPSVFFRIEDGDIHKSFDRLKDSGNSSSLTYRNSLDLVNNLIEKIGVKLVVIDDIPPNANQGTMGKVKQFVELAYNQGASVIFTTNMHYDDLVKKISQHSGYFKTDTATKLEERFRQVYQVVDFQGNSMRSTQRKWYENGQEVTTKLSPNEFLLAQVLLQIAEKNSLSTEEIEKLRSVVESGS